MIEAKGLPIPCNEVIRDEVSASILSVDAGRIELSLVHSTCTEQLAYL